MEGHFHGMNGIMPPRGWPISHVWSSIELEPSILIFVAFGQSVSGRSELLGGFVMFASISSHLSYRWPTFVTAAVFVAALLVSPELAQAQFTQQGPKLVGTGAVGNAGQESSVALSADGNTAIVGGFGDNQTAAGSFAVPSWLATMRLDKPSKATPSRCPPTATPP
jgi:hypothetical protein